MSFTVCSVPPWLEWRRLPEDQSQRHLICAPVKRRTEIQEQDRPETRRFSDLRSEHDEAVVWNRIGRQQPCKTRSPGSESVCRECLRCRWTALASVSGSEDVLDQRIGRVLGVPELSGGLLRPTVPCRFRRWRKTVDEHRAVY